MFLTEVAAPRWSVALSVFVWLIPPSGWQTVSMTADSEDPMPVPHDTATKKNIYTEEISNKAEMLFSLLLL